MEAFGLGVFLFVACAAAALIEHPSSTLHAWLGDAFTRRALMGAIMGITALLLFTSPWGKRSGAHLNPAVTLSFWALDRIGGRDAILYIAAQFAGGLAGTLLAGVAVGMPLRHMGIAFAATVPGPDGALPAFAGETLISFLMMTTVLGLSNSKRWFGATPFAAAVLVALFIAFESPVSGMSMNPARTLASAIPSGHWQSVWIYFLAPPLGMLSAAALHQRMGPTHCAKLDHSGGQRCIFPCEFQRLFS